MCFFSDIECSLNLNECSPKRDTFEMFESPLFKIFSSVLQSFLKSVSLSFEKLGQWIR